MTFTSQQIAKLEAPLDPKFVKPPPQGKYGEYIEGVHALYEANRIFEHEWSSSVQEARLTNATKDGDKHRVGYMVIVNVTAGGVTRSGIGHGQGFGKSEGDAHDSAVKEAETDAIKRALRTFGNPFGLALYDKTKANVQAPPPETISDGQREQMMALLDKLNFPTDRFLSVSRIKDLRDLPAAKFDGAMKWIADEAKKLETENA